MRLCVKKYKILGCLMRLRVLNILLRHDSGLYVCEIIEILEEKQYNISKHLNLMKMIGLIVEEKQGRMVLYKPNYIRENKDLFSSILCVADANKEIFEKDVKRIEEIVRLRSSRGCFKDNN
ncbi:winged helix-turn-helix transcriptional regulator [bacterium]|nr:winged helix-turn-helix transcriptional regulator [bacterium]